MVGIYDIYRGGEKIGKVHVVKEGLYYRFQCCCNLTGEVMYRIIIQCGDKTENLGIPIPDADSFRLNTRIPVSRFAGERPEFHAVPRHKSLEMWVPIAPEKPFDYIARLENAMLERRGNSVGILILDAAPQDSDPSPIHSHESQHPQ